MNNTLELAAPITSAVAAPSAPVDVDKLDTAKPLVEIFQPYQTTLEKWEAKAKSLVVSDIGQVAEMKMARVARLELKDARVAMDKTRKGLVENLKARTSKIDGTARIIREKIEGLEAVLLESEEFAERYAAKVKAELHDKRYSELVPFLDSAIMVSNLSDLSESDYQKYLGDLKLLKQAKIAAVEKIEADRLAKEAADKAERERIAAENARLKAEADKLNAEKAETARLAAIESKRIADDRKAEQESFERERLKARQKADADAAAAESKARKEREVIQAKAAEAAKKAREETDRLNAELAAKAKAEAAEKARIEAERVAKEKEAKRAAAAPDKAKLAVFARQLRGLDLPAFSNSRMRDEVNTRLNALIFWIESQADSELL